MEPFLLKSNLKSIVLQTNYEKSNRVRVYSVKGSYGQVYFIWGNFVIVYFVKGNFDFSL